MVINEWDLYTLKQDDKVHYSDCAVYNEPAYPNEPCDCGAAKARKRWWTYLYHLSCIRYARLRSVLRSRLRTLFGLPPSASNRAPYLNERFFRSEEELNDWVATAEVMSNPKLSKILLQKNDPSKYVEITD